MASIRPFAALRPQPELASRICELPYDVMSSAEAREIARDNPFSFLHVSKPEIDLPPDTHPYAAAVYQGGRDYFVDLIRQGVLRQDEAPGFYLYRQVMGSHVQVGLVGVASVAEYESGMIRKHELTRVDKEDDRVRHIETVGAQTGPVFLTYRAEPALDALVAGKVRHEPEVDFVAADGVRHSAWTLADAATLAEVQRMLAQIPLLYIADGHHRSAAAARVSRASGGAGASAWFLAVLFPHDQLRILPYNRALRNLNGMDADGLRRRLREIFEVLSPGVAAPAGKHSVGLYLEGGWHTLVFRSEWTRDMEPVDLLDVSLLQRLVLDPMFGVKDPRTSERISFVGGIRGTAELERLVDGGGYACAFSMYPTGIEDLMAIADRGGLMPPKSTWFEPKLRDAMFCHMIR